MALKFATTTVHSSFLERHNFIQNCVVCVTPKRSGLCRFKSAEMRQYCCSNEFALIHGVGFLMWRQSFNFQNGGHDVISRKRLCRFYLRSSSFSSLIVSRTRLSAVGGWAFPVAAAHVWNSLPDLFTSAPSVAVFRSRLKTHLFNISHPSPLWLYSSRAVTLSCFGHYNRSSLLTYLLTLPNG